MCYQRRSILTWIDVTSFILKCEEELYTPPPNTSPPRHRKKAGFLKSVKMRGWGFWKDPN